MCIQIRFVSTEKTTRIASRACCCKMHSTEYPAVKLVDYVSKQMESGHTPCNVYIDLSKTFDTLPFDILLHKLKYYGFSSIEIKLLKNYFRHKTEYVMNNNYHSDNIGITTVTGYWFLMGQLLVYFYSVSIYELNFPMYADDTTLYFNLEDFNLNHMQAEINN